MGFTYHLSQRSCVIIIFAKVSLDKAEDSNKYREVSLGNFRKVILSGARAPEREKDWHDYLAEPTV